mgnify:CR=1 FL=1
MEGLLPPTVTLTAKETTMGKVKLIVHEFFAGKQNPEDVFAAVFLLSAAVRAAYRRQLLFLYIAPQNAPFINR